MQIKIVWIQHSSKLYNANGECVMCIIRIHICGDFQKEKEY